MPHAHGLFVGLITLDLLYLAANPPDRNQKIVALDYVMAAGGPATNAAVAFQYLGNAATLLGGLGQHPTASFVSSDLQRQNVRIVDLSADRQESVPMSSIIVTQATGERAVVSLNASRSQISADAIPQQFWTELTSHATAIVLMDGHQMEVSRAVAEWAREHHIPIVIDGGSWKPGFERVLCLADYAICSANFRPPGCSTAEEGLNYLSALQIPHIAITYGDQPIQFLSQGQTGALPVPAVPVVDTLGAGDIFHGAFCHFILHSSFTDALTHAAAIAAHSCRSFGTRRWMETMP
jgi:sugar/nucleoside kinase (ribokinase family)